MKFALFYQSFVSCWNNGHAHFLRGIARELVRLGHQVTVYEPENGWSRGNALRDGGASILAEAKHLVPGVNLQVYDPETLDLDRVANGVDVVMVHEWNDPKLIANLGERRSVGARFLLLFHDAHHRAITAPHEIGRYSLESYDAVLTFGEVLRQVYLKLGWGRRVFTWHEAADIELFRPQPDVPKDVDLIWIGNWGDGERDQELQEYLVGPLVNAGLKARLYGVRYPDHAREQLSAAGIAYRNWLPNHRAPHAFARARLTMHVARRPYVEALPGIPTIRVFEALACGIPLVCAPWHDTEELFPDGSFLKVRNSEEATAALRLLTCDREFAAEMANTGLHAIHERHTCAHRVQELLDIVRILRPGVAPPAPRAGRELNQVAES